MTSDKKPCEPEIEFRLYVVLHGLICLVDEGNDGFTAYLPDMQEQHRYLYGDWLWERSIPPVSPGDDPFTAELYGVCPGNALLCSEQNAIVELSDDLNDYTDIRAQITLPRPCKIYQFLCGNVVPHMFNGAVLPNSTFSQDDQFIGKVPPKKVCAVRVFEYIFPSWQNANGEDVNDVALRDPDDNPLWVCPDLAEVIIRKDDEDTPVGPCERVCRHDTRTLKVATLHIYNEPGRDLKKSSSRHNIREFNLTTDFLGFQDVTLVRPPSILGDDADVPPGMLEGEIDPLSFRHDTILELLLASRTGDPSEGVGGSSGPVCCGANATHAPGTKAASLIKQKRQKIKRKGTNYGR